MITAAIVGAAVVSAAVVSIAPHLPQQRQRGLLVRGSSLLPRQHVVECAVDLLRVRVGVRVRIGVRVGVGVSQVAHLVVDLVREDLEDDVRPQPGGVELVKVAQPVEAKVRKGLPRGKEGGQLWKGAVDRASQK